MGIHSEPGLYRKLVELLKLLNIYLNPVDHYIKRQLAVRHYVRYVDDMLLVGLDRGRAMDCREAVTNFLRQYLCLGLSKSTIQRIGPRG